MEELLDQLMITRDKTLEYFELPEAELSKTYAPGKWTVKQLLHHVVDSETVMYSRLRRVISEPRQVIWGFDQDAWCETLNYTDMPLTANRVIFAGTRTAIMHLAERFYDSHGNKPFIHSETGLRTLKDEFDKIAWHNAHHLQQIKQALEK